MSIRPLITESARAASIAALLAAAAASAGFAASASASQSRSSSSASVFAPVRYDVDYPVIGYSRTPTRNAIARLQQKLDSGEARLHFTPGRGYLDSLLQALAIDPSSQVLVYSKSSLQIEGIRAATPRAIYFNDDTYVAWVQGSELLEIATMDAELGAVFYTFENRPGAPQLQRETNRCLNCHDTFGLSGGGVPRFLALSAPVDLAGVLLRGQTSRETGDGTPLRERWGGWYVTGRHGEQQHLGNLQVRDAGERVDLEPLRRGNLDSLADLFDTSPYLTDKSDIVALLIFEHQVYVKNLITRLNFKARTFLARVADGEADAAAAWEAAPPRVRQSLERMTEQLLEALLFVDATGFTARITGSSGFDAWFQAQGPRDARGRSLRDLDLETRLFEYPLSYQIYSESFDALPDPVRRHLYARLRAILESRDDDDRYAHLSSADRRAILEILTATKPEFTAAG